MPNIASILKEEIQRLARKELKANTEPLKKAVAGYRSEIAALKRRVETLERQARRTSKVVAKAVAAEPGAEGKNLRFRADGFASKRKNLGLSAREVGLLLDASPLSVYKWETGQARPRAKHLEAIAAFRSLGKREAAKRLEELAVQSRS